MNKRIHTLLLAATVLLSCSSGHDDPFVPEPDNAGISFGGNNGTWQDAPTTRAQQNGLESLFKTFRAWGYKTTTTSSDNTPSAPQVVMDGYQVKFINGAAGSTESNTTGWEYVGIPNTALSTIQTIKYWDFSATSYRFFAYSPFDTDAAVSVKTTNDATSSSAGASSTASSSIGVSSAGSSSDGVSTPVATASFSFPFEYSDVATATSIPYISDLWFAKSSAAASNGGSDDSSSNGASSASSSSDGASSAGSSSDGVSTPVAKYGSCVTLTFAPIIAKVRFKFTYPNGTEEILVKDILFCDSRFIDDTSAATTPLRGTITATYPLEGSPTTTTPTMSWKAPATSGGASHPDTGPLLFTIPYEEESDKIHILDDAKLYGKWYYVPPLNIIHYIQGAYTMTATIDGYKVSATVPEQFMQWKAGFQYTYIFKITETDKRILFDDLQVEQWLPGPDIDNQGSGTESW